MIWSRPTLMALALAGGLFGACMLLTGCAPDSTEGSGESSQSEATSGDSLPQSILDRLRSNPYLSWQKISDGDSADEGVPTYDSTQAHRGLNLYNVDGESQAFLLDMQGQPVHAWTGTGEGWHHVELGNYGMLWAVIRDKKLLKVDWNSAPQCSLAGRFHHDLAIDPAGRLHALVRETRMIPFKDHRIPILDDYVVTFSPNLEVKRKVSLWDLMGDRVSPEKLEAIDEFLKNRTPKGVIETYDWLGSLCDIFHANSIEWIERDLKGICHRGDLLLSVRQLNLIVIIDQEKSEVLWDWGGEDLWRQHHASVVPGGDILLFDNRKPIEGSRALQVDPASREIVWEFWPKTGREFFSRLRGGCQRLPNGNTLITLSDKGRAVEITPRGEIVWEFWNEKDEHQHRRRAIYRMTRILPSDLPELPVSTAR